MPSGDYLVPFQIFDEVNGWERDCHLGNHGSPPSCSAGSWCVETSSSAYTSRQLA